MIDQVDGRVSEILNVFFIYSWVVNLAELLHTFL